MFHVVRTSPLVILLLAGACSPSGTDPDTDPATDPETPADSGAPLLPPDDTEPNPPPDSEAPPESDLPVETDEGSDPAEPESDPLDTDLLDTEPVDSDIVGPIVETAGGDSDGTDVTTAETASHTDMTHTDIDSTSVTEPGDTDTRDTEPEPPAVDTSPPAPPVQRCVFPRGIVIPDDAFRTLDFEIPNFGYLHSATDFYPVPFGGELLGYTFDLRLGDTLSFYSLEVAGRVFHETNRLGSLTPSVTANGPASSMFNGADLDSDGAKEWVGRVSRLGRNLEAVAAYVPPTGDVLMDDANWWFTSSNYADYADIVTSGDFNGDGHDDLFIRVRPGNPGAWTGYWLEGPFPQGDYDIAATAVASGSWNTLLSRFVAGDFNNDGVDDLILQVEDPARANWFEARMFFGPFRGNVNIDAPHLVLRDLGSFPRGWWGPMIAPGDLNGDGATDLVVSVPEAGPLLNQGATFVFHGPFSAGGTWTEGDAHAVIRWPHAYASVGNPIVALGDVDGDSLPEFAVSARASSATTPPDVDLTVAWPPGVPTPVGGSSEWAVMVFGDPPAGEVGPNDAKFTVFGANSADRVGYYGIFAPGDLNGDGRADLAVSSVGAIGATVRILHPCTDFGIPVP